MIDHIEGGPLGAAEIAAATATDPVLSQVWRHVMEGWPEKSVPELSAYSSRYLQLSAENGCVLYSGRVVVPAELRDKVLRLLHEAHPGCTRMKSLARGYVWWPKMEQDIESAVRDCGTCQSLQPASRHEAFIPWTWPSRRWQRVFMDFATTEGQKLLVTLDGHSKLPEVRIMKRTDAASLIGVLRTMFATWGLPEEMVSDNGSPFQSAELAEFFKNNGIRHTFSPTYHPSSNGLSEVGVKTVNLSLEKQLLDTRTSSRSLQHRIDAWCFSYRNTPHTVIGVTPFELFLGRQPRTPLSFLRPSNIMAEKMRELQEKKKMNQRAKVTTYQPGDKVWVRSVTHRVVNWVPGTIECAVSSVSYDRPRQP